jgi:Spy/CpxP family protein refolding chaperone
MKRLILATTLILAVTSAFAQDTAPRDGTLAIHRIERRLGLTPAQIAQAKVIIQQERPNLQQLHIQLAAEHKAIAAQTTFDESKTRAIATQYAETNTAAIVEREKRRSELLAILTPTQQQRLQQLRSRFSARLDERLQTLGDGL